MGERRATGTGPQKAYARASADGRASRNRDRAAKSVRALERGRARVATSQSGYYY